MLISPLMFINKRKVLMKYFSGSSNGNSNNSSVRDETGTAVWYRNLFYSQLSYAILCLHPLSSQMRCKLKFLFFFFIIHTSVIRMLSVARDVQLKMEEVVSMFSSSRQSRRNQPVKDCIIGLPYRLPLSRIPTSAQHGRVFCLF